MREQVHDGALSPTQREAVLASTVSWLLSIDADLALAVAQADMVDAHILPMPPHQWQVTFAAPAPWADVLMGAIDDEDEAGAPIPGPLLFGLANTLPESRMFPNVEVVTADIASLPQRVSSRWRNQGVLYPGPGSQKSNGLRYRSGTEVRVAEALDASGVLWFPLPVAVRGGRTVEPDFLVVTMGRVGVLEVDGPHHTPLTRAQEDATAAWLYRSGVRLVHHVNVQQIDQDVSAVVREFLTLLRGPVL